MFIFLYATDVLVSDGNVLAGVAGVVVVVVHCRCNFLWSY